MDSRDFQWKCPLCGEIISASHEDMLMLGTRFHDLNVHDLDSIEA